MGVITQIKLVLNKALSKALTYKTNATSLHMNYLKHINIRVKTVLCEVFAFLV